MPRALRSPRDHLDAIVELVTLTLGRKTLAPAELATHDLAIVELGEDLEAGLAVARARGEELPLDRLRAAFQLEPAEMACLQIALAVAISSPLRELANRRDGTITLELLDALVYSSERVRAQAGDQLARDGRLFTYGLLEEVSTDRHRSSMARPVAVAERVVEIAYGRERLGTELARYATLRDPAEHDLLIANGVVEHVCAALRRHVDTGTGAIPVVRGAEGSGRRAILEVAVRALGAKLLVVRCEHLPGEGFAEAVIAIKREAVYARAAIVLANVDAVVEDRRPFLAAAFARYPGPIAFTTRTETRAHGLAAERGIAQFDIPALTEYDAATIWARTIPTTLALDAAARYRLTGGQIERAARVIRSLCRDRDPTTDDLQAGVRAIGDDKLTTLGVRIEWRQSWQDLVLPRESLDELHEMISRVRNRRLVIDEWGFGAKMAKGLGVAALFSGPPGTGKTMAAGLVARELGLDLYQIDLSRMVSKYVGETEKNLASVFEGAEAGHAILLFDEADSLFSKRTEVKSSVDRYANLEVNYLLQRMEQFEGITILTTNFDSVIDEAFRRRIAFRLHFPLPELEERKQLWRAMLPPAALSGEAIDFAVLASRFAMSGGYIKNAALRAAYLAAGEATKIGMTHLVRAATAEYTSMGKIMTSGTDRGR